ncbi:MAG: hypothetical protein RLN72_14655 [Henriciella sp.]
MKRCLAHVGMNKAGSTTIQQWLRANAGELRQQFIVYDPLEDGPPNSLTHDFGFPAIGLGDRHLAAAAARKRFAIETVEDHRARREEFMRRAEASIEAAGERLYVISSERLQGWLLKGDELRRFTGWLEQHFDKVEYVIYVRDQIDWFASAYSQAVKTGSADTLEGFMVRNGTIDYAEIAARWAEIGGPGSVTVRLLERDALGKGGLLMDFADLLGAAPDGVADVARLNPSMTGDAVVAMAALNAKIAAEPKLAADPAVKSERDALARTVDGPSFKLPEAVALDVARRHAASNEALRKTFFPDRPHLFAKSHAVLQSSEATS